MKRPLIIDFPDLLPQGTYAEQEANLRTFQKVYEQLKELTKDLNITIVTSSGKVLCGKRKYEFRRLRKEFDTFEIFEDGEFLGIVDHMPFRPVNSRWRCLIQGRAQCFSKIVELEQILKERRW